MKKKICWATPTYFIDVDVKIVPKLSEVFNIIWIIFGKNKPATYNKMLKLADDNLALEFYNMNSQWYSPSNFFDYKKFYLYLRSKNCNVIYLDMAPQLFSYYAACKYLNKDNTIFAAHNVKTPKGARHEAMARYYMKKLLNSFNNFQVFSKNQQQYLHQLVGDRNVLYAPLTLKDYGPKLTRKNNVGMKNFLSFGHIRGYKRIDLLIEAAQKLYEETGEDFKVTIAGNCVEWNTYRRLIKYPKLFDLRIGFVRDEDIPQLFADADFLVLPYQDLAQSGAITVAFNYDVPVITSDIPQFKEFVEEGVNGMMFTSESAEDLKNVMKRALQMTPEQYSTLKSSTANFVNERYSLDAIAKKYIEYINAL